MSHALKTLGRGFENIAELLRKEDAQGMVEYALILLFVSVVAITVISFLGPQISLHISEIGASL